MPRILLTFLIFLAFGQIASPSVVFAQTTFTVNSANDFDDGTCDGNHCSLREAINVANTTGGTDTIAFNLTSTDPGYVSSTDSWVIRPTSSLPTITDPVVIDGYTQPGASPNTNGPGLGLNTVLRIELDGTIAGADVNGLHITAGSSTVRGLVINRFGGNGIELVTNGGNVIDGNFIGTDVTGTADLGNIGSGVLLNGAPSNTVGGTTPGARNVITGNEAGGVRILGNGVTGNVVQGNFIGTDVTGSIVLGNSNEGVLIIDASDSAIGGTESGAGNIISFNGVAGVRIQGNGATGNVVQGNLIGTDITGTAALGNRGDGVSIRFSASNNTIGGTTAGARNVISGNDGDGVDIAGPGTDSNAVSGNYIGTTVAGLVALGNSANGVAIDSGPQFNTIGGTTLGERNLISGNGGNGVIITGSGTSDNIVSGNFIGADISGSTALPNSGFGVSVKSGASGNTIGGVSPQARNVISGNNSTGIVINSAGNAVQGNFIGTDSLGSGALANGGNGILVSLTPPGTPEVVANTNIGGTESGARNTIAYNGFVGIVVGG